VNCIKYLVLCQHIFIFFANISLAVQGAKRGRLCRPKAPLPLPFMASEPPETPFSTSKKRNSAGEVSKMQRVFLSGRSGQTCPLGGGAELQVFRWK
jgi:hypothetical protein